MGLDRQEGMGGGDMVGPDLAGGIAGQRVQAGVNAKAAQIVLGFDQVGLGIAAEIALRPGPADPFQFPRRSPTTALV